MVGRAVAFILVKEICPMGRGLSVQRLGRKFGVEIEAVEACFPGIGKVEAMWGICMSRPKQLLSPHTAISNEMQPMSLVQVQWWCAASLMSSCTSNSMAMPRLEPVPGHVSAHHLVVLFTPPPRLLLPTGRSWRRKEVHAP